MSPIEMLRRQAEKYEKLAAAAPMGSDARLAAEVTATQNRETMEWYGKEAVLANVRWVSEDEARKLFPSD